MRHITLALLLWAVAAAAAAQDRADIIAAELADQDSRDALIKSALARDRGEITAMEATGREGQGVVIGYGTGTVLNCYGDSHCTEFSGTPNVAVSRIAVSHDGDGEIYWVAYPHGIIYRCSGRQCRQFLWEPPTGD